MKYIGLDLGTRTLGVSISDKSGLIASSFKTIHFTEENYDELIDELKIIIKEKEVEKMVLGFPKNMDNSLGDSAKRSLEFKKILEQNFNMDVILEDERMSTMEAHNIMISGNLSRSKRKKKVDALAATIILQRYLDKRKG